MAGLRIKRSSSKTVIGGTEPVVEELNVQTATNMYPGRLVKKGTNDDDVVLNDGNTTALGWLGYEHTPTEYRKAAKTTIYAASDKVGVLKGGGFILDALAVDTSGETIAKGDRLKPAATLGGVLKMATTDPSTNSALPCAIAEESVTIPAAGSIAILVRSLI